MEEIFKRIEDLIRVCKDDTRYGVEYDSIKFEINNLILELAGRNSELYSNFILVYNDKYLSAGQKQKQFIGVLNGLKNGLKIQMNEKRFQVFISSTFIDLESYRKTISDEIIFRGHISAGMEDFTACGEDLETYIKRVIDQSDYYVLILGQRWGSALPNDGNTSYTMMEYEYAKSKNMRIIPMIYNGDVTLVGNDLEINGKKFEKFKQEISKLVPQYFKDENELIRKLTKALEKEIKNHPQKGWIRL